MEIGITLAGLIFGVSSGVHALLNKRDPAARLNWTLACFFVPVIGAVIYWLLGSNRIRTRAQKFREEGLGPGSAVTPNPAKATVDELFPVKARELSILTSTSERVTRMPIVRGNLVEPLVNGEAAYPSMLEAIENATKRIYLCTYIFDSDAAGKKFLGALTRAADRGVEVKILVDALGERYGRPRIGKFFRRRKNIHFERFLPFSPLKGGFRINLRNHRKLLIVDDHVGFTGGMNIGQRHMVEDDGNKHKTADLHFRFVGPIVGSFVNMFREDWYFATKQQLDPPEFGYQEDDEAGDALCRGIPDGPNEDFEVLQWILVGALSCAKKRIQIMTPYFIPGPHLISAIHAAVLRGVQVDIILPHKNNLLFVHWAMQAMLRDVIRFGARVYYQPPPFNHSKLLLIDEFYILIGSANLDPRSLQLNFEFNVEIYDEHLGAQLSEQFDRIRDKSHLVSREELDRFGFFRRLRNALASLAGPYL